MCFAVIRRLALGSLLLLTGVAGRAEEAVPSPSLVPWPKAIRLEPGYETLAPGARIVAQNAELAPLAGVLAEEIGLITAHPLTVGNGAAGKGDITLRLAANVPAAEGYRLTVGSDGILVEGRTYGGVAWGTVTLLQALESTNGQWRLPRMTVADEPQLGYRGVLIDVARRYNSIGALKRVVVMCRLYKIRYLQLHLTDDQAWTFPSTAFPKLGSTNKGFRGPIPRVYTLEELKDLVAFADARSVTIIPELETVGHSDQLRIPYPKVFDAFEDKKENAHMGIVDMANPHAYQGLDVLVGEMCEVFKSSPYFHIGADEANMKRALVSSNYPAFTAEHNLSSPYELFCYFVREMDTTVRKHGKRTIIWGDGVKPPGSEQVTIPSNILVMAWRNKANDARNFVSNGFEVVNATWNPLYVVNQTWETFSQPGGTNGQTGKYTPETIYNWNPQVFDRLVLKATPLVVGGQLCAWEQGGEIQTPVLRSRVPALSERTWNPALDQPYGNFSSRLQATDALLERLVSVIPASGPGQRDEPATGSTSGKTTPGLQK